MINVKMEMRLCSDGRIRPQRRKKTDEERAEHFWSLVDKLADDQCWPWRGTRASNGYGHFMARKQAHRFSYELHKGPIPDGLYVIHQCDNPSCVNPRHISVGTQAQNISDCIGKRRHAHRLTDDQVRQIRLRPNKGKVGFGVASIAAKLGISAITVKRILNGKSHKHIT